MSFLTPLFLVGLLAAMIPVVIHLIRKDNPPQVIFSTLRFFQQTTRKQFLFQQFQQWLLLLLRALIIFLLVFAFARPFFSQGMSALANMAPRSIVIALDTSLSMTYDNYFKAAKTRSLKILDELNQGDEAAIILFANDVVAVHGPTVDIDSLKNIINNTDAPNHSSTRLLPPLRVANDLLSEARFEQRSIYLLSDYQLTGMAGFDTSFKLDPGIELFTEKLPFNSFGSSEQSKTKNLSISGVKIPDELRSGSESQELFVRVRSTGNVKIDADRLTVLLNDKTVASVPVDLSAKSEDVISIPLSLTEIGSYVGSITVDGDDDFPADNTVFFTLDILPKIKVLVINGESSPNWYDDESHWFGLAVAGDKNSPFDIINIDVTDFSEQQAKNILNNVTDANINKSFSGDVPKVVVLLNVATLSTNTVDVLRRYVEDGGSVLMAPGDRVRAGAFNESFSVISPATLIDKKNLTNNDYLLITDIKNHHPILESIDIDWGTRFEGYWSMKPVDQSEILMKFDNGKPALVEQKVGKGRSIIFGSSLDLEWNNFPLQSAYLPFVHETLKYLAQTSKKKSSYVVGDRISLLEGNTIALTDPSNVDVLSFVDRAFEKDIESGVESRSGNKNNSDIKNKTKNNFLAEMPGFYLQTMSQVMSQVISQANNKNATIVYAVNNPIEESNLMTIDPGNLFDAVLNSETKPTQTMAVKLKVLKAELEKPQRVWWYLLFVVFILLLAESMIANKTYR